MSDALPVLALPPRPPRPLSALALLRTVAVNSLAACDEALFDELLVERRLLWRRLFVISDPAGFRRVLQENSANYLRVSPVRRAFEFSARSGMVCLEGEAWRRHRRVINPALDHRALRPDVPALIRLAEEAVEPLERLSGGEPVELGRTLTHLLIRMNRQVFAGAEPELDAILLRMGRYPENYGPFDLLPLPRPLRFLDRRARRSGVDAYYPLLDRLIAARCRDDYQGPRDLLWRMAQARGGESLDLAEIRDEVLTLAATALTPLRALTWMWYLLALHPGSEARLHAELDQMLDGQLPAPDDLPKLVYLRQVVDETMRLYPPLPLTLRSAAADDIVCGRPVARGSIVAVAPWVVHRHRLLWADPERFDPDRFAPAAADRRRDAFIPFGVGPHVCPGAALAITEILIAAAILAQRFRLRLVPGQAIEPVAWTTLRPRRGLYVTIERRR